MKTLCRLKQAISVASLFRRSSSGNVALVFALAALPVIAAAGAAIDFVRAENVQTSMQTLADRTALGVVATKGASAEKEWLAKLEADLKEQNGPQMQNISAKGMWISATDYRVSIEGQVAVSLLAAVPGMNDKMSIGAAAVARATVTAPVWKVPTVSQLDYEAADYNRIYVYCYDKTKKNNPGAGRSQETAIADNGGTSYKFKMPQCAEGETMSYRLFNSRNARTTKSNWDNPKNEHYNYYSDTTYTKGVESYNFQDDVSILENVLCDNLSVCKEKSKGGVIPSGKNRTPQRATTACAPGKFMFYGWEDRPPGKGWTDQDYDDIRIIIECPEKGMPGQIIVRLIQ